MMSDMTTGELRGFIDTMRGAAAPADCVVVGTVVRVDPDGTAWVQIGANPEPTPCARDMACHAGDEVTVRIADHKATVTGNASAPATDDKRANAAQQTANIADERAVSAMRAAQTAEDYATSAQASAARASGEAAQAHQSATAASNYATTALAGLGSVQNVADTLMWITQHGQMTLTADTEPDPTKLYFVADPEGDYTVGGVHYSTVTEVDPDHMGDYYEMSMLESVQNYLLTHLAVTDEGLQVFGDNSRIIVGTSDSFHVVIDATQERGEIAFCQGMTEDAGGNPVHNRVAWVSNNELHIPRAIITEGVQVGRYRWVELTNGNFALKYVD